VWFLAAAAATAQSLAPGGWAGRDLSAFPLPVSGYDVYMLGEVHGVRETVAVFAQYLAKLYEQAGLRDVALEEKPAYEGDAQAYTEGKSDRVPAPLCLRAGVLEAIRRFNQAHSAGPVRVHLVDIDLNAAAIRDHLLALRRQVPGAAAVKVPAAGAIAARGLVTVAALDRLASAPAIQRELRTVRHSIRTLQLGLDVAAGQFKGSPYLDDREDAIVANITDVLRDQRRPLLALYGNDHVSKTLLRNGGPRQDSDFPPAALRLERAGIRVFSLVTLPLDGRSNWRGRESGLLWTAADGSLSSGETLDRVFARAPGTAILYIDPAREPVRLPSQDLTRSGADAFLLFARGTPAEDRCPAR
jgi:hypothetical protein